MSCTAMPEWKRSSVLASVEICVEELGSETEHSPAQFPQAGLACRIAEDQVAHLPVKRIGFVEVIRHEQIQPAIAIRVPGRHTHAGL